MQDCKAAECQNSHVMQHLGILIYNMPKCPKEEYAGSQVSWLSMDGCWMDVQLIPSNRATTTKKGRGRVKNKTKIYVFCPSQSIPHNIDILLFFLNSNFLFRCYIK